MKKYVNMGIVKAELSAPDDAHVPALYRVYEEGPGFHLEGVEEFEETHIELNEVHAEPLLRFFEYKQLPPHLQKVSRPFGLLAQVIVSTSPASHMRTRALDLLIASKDAAVRAVLT